MILQLAPRDFSVLGWMHDAGETSACRLAKDRIKAASAGAVLAPKLYR